MLYNSDIPAGQIIPSRYQLFETAIPWPCFCFAIICLISYLPLHPSLFVSLSIYCFLSPSARSSSLFFLSLSLSLPTYLTLFLSPSLTLLFVSLPLTLLFPPSVLICLCSLIMLFGSNWPNKMGPSFLVRKVGEKDTPTHTVS